MAKIANVALTNTFETWRLRSNEAFDRLSQFAIKNSALYANTITANVQFNVLGNASLSGVLSTYSSGNVVISGTYNAGPLVRITQTGTGAALLVEDSSNPDSTPFIIDASGNLGVGTLTPTYPIDTTGVIRTTSTSGIYSNQLLLRHDGTNAYVHPMNSGGGLYLGSNNQNRIFISSAGLTTVTNSLTVGKNLTIQGNTTFGNGGTSLTLNGAVNVNDSITIGDNLVVSGNTTLGNSGSLDKTTITGGVTLNQSISVAKNAMVSGNTVLGSSATQSITTLVGGVTMNQSLAIGKNVTVSGNTTLAGTINSASANILNQTLSDGSTISWNTALGQIATVTIAGNRTVAAPTNLKVGTYILRVYQDAAGNRLLTWKSIFKWTAGVAPVLSTGANKLDIFTFFSDGTYLYGSYLPDMR